MGVPPAKLDEKARFVGRAILPADSLSAGPTACKAGCFFDPVKTRQTMVTDDKRRSSVLLLIAGLRFRREHIAFTAARVDQTRRASGIELGAQALDIDADDVGEGVKTLVPDVLGNRVPAHDAALAEHQEL